MTISDNERIMYVLQRADDKFYWKNQNTSSSYGYVDGFDKAFLFSSEKGAKSRMGYGCQGQECEIKQVKVTLINK